MASLNRAELIGNLGRDPEVRHTPDGTKVVNFTLATNERWKDRESGEMRERVEWHRLVCWRRLAEIAGEHLKKGSQIYVAGKLQTRKWTDRDGNERYTTEIVVRELQMLGKKTDVAGEPPASEEPPAGEPIDDDIPF